MLVELPIWNVRSRIEKQTFLFQRFLESFEVLREWLKSFTKNFRWKTFFETSIENSTL